MKKIILVIALLIPFAVQAQIAVEWSRNYKGTFSSDDFVSKSVNDEQGNLYVLCAANGPEDILLIKYTPSGVMVWQKIYSYNPFTKDIPVDLEIENDYLYLAGNIETSSENHDIVLLKYDTNGNVIWTKIYANTNGTNDECSDMHVDNSGNVYLIGKTYLGTVDILTLKYTTNGNLLFVRNYHNIEGENDIGISVTSDSFGNTYAGGLTFASGKVNTIAVVIKYGTSGNTIWGRYQDSYYQNNLSAITTDQSDNLLVVINNFTSDWNSTVATIKYSSEGSVIWNINYSTTNNLYESFRGLKIDDSGKIYICIMASFSESYAIILKYNENGTVIYETTYKVLGSGTLMFHLLNSDEPFIGSFQGINDSLRKLTFAHFNENGNLLRDTTYDLEFNNNAIYSYTCYNNDFYLTGAKVNGSFFDPDRDAVIHKFNTQFNFLWTQIFLGETIAIIPDYAYEILKEPSGNIIIAGCGYRLDATCIVLQKFNPAGDLMWRSAIPSQMSVTDNKLSMCFDNNGNVLLTGYAYSSGTNADVVVMKFDNAGNMIWTISYEGTASSNDKPAGISADDQGNIYITGFSTRTGTGEDMFTAKLTSNGNFVWSKFYDASGGKDNALDLSLDNGGNVYVAGSCTQAASGIDGILIKYNNAGDQQWVRFRNGFETNTDILRKVVVDEQNNIYTAGEYHAGTNGVDAITIKYSPDGSLLWEKTYSGSSNNDRINDMILKNNVLSVTGESIGTGTLYDFITINYELNGNVIWEKRYNGSINRNDRAFCIDADEEGYVYVSGQSNITTNDLDIFTIKYNNTGDEVWSGRFSGSASNGADMPSSLLVSAPDVFYVSGTLVNNGSANDIALIKYSPSVGINEPSSAVITQYLLHDNYPNPFNPQTKIVFEIPISGNVTVKIFDLSGKEVRTLLKAYKNEGRHEVSFDAAGLSSGVYFCRLESRNVVLTKKMMLVK